ncbi:MAG: hypothetical protein D6707_04590 [Bacteroidetes bacterium]|nr:MAG: hypothetical protein D6707_04590 [Bacteroidota bacterium]
MKKLLVAVVVFCSFNAFSQKAFIKLAEFYEAGRYEDCAYKAENMMMNDNYRKDPRPYLYFSMCNWEIAQMPDKAEEYPKAYDDALKYAAKAVKKDKDGSYQEKFKDYFLKVKEEHLKVVSNYYQEKDYRKAASEAKKLLKIFPEDYALMFFRGVCSFLANNQADGSLNVKEAMQHLNSQNVDSLSEPLLEEAFAAYAKYLQQKQMTDSAQSTLDIGMTILKDAAKLSEIYSEINAN